MSLDHLTEHERGAGAPELRRLLNEARAQTSQIQDWHDDVVDKYRLARRWAAKWKQVAKGWYTNAKEGI